MRRSVALGGILLAVLATGIATAGNKKQQAKETAPAPTADGITREQADAILSELKEMRALLEKLVSVQANARPAAPAPPPIVSVKIPADAQMLGSKTAPYTMVEYMDLQCPFCKRFEETTFAEIRKNLIDTGKVRYVSRDFPLDFHPFAMKAAVAARCAAEQGKFWPMRNLLVTNAADLSADAITRYAKTAGLDATAFSGCQTSNKYDAAIRDSVKEATTAGVQGTPSFVLGKSTPDGVTGTVIVGALPYPAFEAEMQKLETK
jgi:protein-disulfide isomerase